MNLICLAHSDFVYSKRFRVKFEIEAGQTSEFFLDADHKGKTIKAVVWIAGGNGNPEALIQVCLSSKYRSHVCI